MSIPSVRKHTNGVIATLEAAGLTVGDADAKGLTAPYCVVYAIPGGEFSGTLEQPYEDGELPYQVTCVGATREQAEWVTDKALNALIAGVTVAGWSVGPVKPEGNAGVRPDHDVTPPLFYSTPRFTLKTTPN